MSSKPVLSSRPLAVYLARRRVRIYVISGLSVLLILVAALALTAGSVKIPFLTTCQVLISRLPWVHMAAVWPKSVETIILDIRLPRVILAGLVGAALATAGATYQGLFRNPLADPYLIGVAQGASLGAVAGFLLPAALPLLGLGIVPLFAFAGAVLSTALVYGVSRVGKALPVTTLILAGVALGALFGAITSYLIVSSGESIHGIVFWLMGSFSLAQWADVKIVFPCVGRRHRHHPAFCPPA